MGFYVVAPEATANREDIALVRDWLIAAAQPKPAPAKP